MITPLVEMLEVPNFGHMTTCTIQFGSRDNILTSEIRHQPLFQNTFILSRQDLE